MIGVLSCSGEDFPGGSVSRIAVRKVLGEYLPHDTTTICVPLFLAGDDNEQQFVRTYPCITVDGCPLRCAAKSVEALGRTPLQEFVVPDFFAPEEQAQIDAGPLHDRAWLEHPLCLKLAAAIADRVAEEKSKPPA
jgi:hypothetical protein